MLLALNTSTIKPQPLLEKIRLAAEAGFGGIELWANDIYEHVGRGGEVSDVEHALANCGLVVPCMIAMRGWGDAVGPEYQVMLDECRRRMELAARLGSPFIVATPPRGECPLAVLAERYRDLLQIGRQSGVRPTFEYISIFRSATRLRDAWEVVQQAADPDATLVLDAFHTYNSGGSLEDVRQLPLAKISHYHINDAAPGLPLGQQTDSDRVMPGDGVLDLKAEMAVLREKGYQGAISLELFNRQLWEQDPRQVLRVAMERLREIAG